MTSTPQVPQMQLPKGTTPLENQVAGHTFQAGTDAIGILKDQRDGCILKPAGKPICGEREIRFYECLENSTEECLLTLKKFVPKYKGTIRMVINGKQLDFIKLSDLTFGMEEPCIMDIKVGKRTWDPLATKDKIAAEEEKYAICKKGLGLCIPGFQVHSLSTEKLHRYGKDYGKKLNETTFKDTLRMFLNAESGVWYRPLLVEILSSLWSIQKWCRTQTCYKFYSSSILLLYDAAKLHNSQDDKNNCNRPNGSNITNIKNSPSANDVRLQSSQNNGSDDTIPAYRKVQRNHSVKNNYDEDMKIIRENYAYMLDNLIGDTYEENRKWVDVKMIDFAHAFASDDDSLDTNYIFGVDNLVKIFEEFLKDCDQVRTY